MSFDELSPEIQEKAKACKSREELEELAAAIGIRLSDDEIESVAGGDCVGHCEFYRVICRVDSECKTNKACPIK